MFLMNENFMLRALEVSKNALPYCLPNPPVGCVLIKDNRIVAEGYTQKDGHTHAEVEAMLSYSKALDEIIVYVTLEPCSFQGRTPSCAMALVDSGIKDIVVAMLDPDPRNNGKGIQILRDAGIHVEVGLCSSIINTFLFPYLIKGNSS